MTTAVFFYFFFIILFFYNNTSAAHSMKAAKGGKPFFGLPGTRYCRPFKLGVREVDREVISQKFGMHVRCCLGWDWCLLPILFDVGPCHTTAADRSILVGLSGGITARPRHGSRTWHRWWGVLRPTFLVVACEHRHTVGSR